MTSFIHSESVIRVYRVCGGNKLDEIPQAIWQHKPLMKNVLISFDGDAESILLSILIYLEIANTYIYNGYPKLKSIF